MTEHALYDPKVYDNLDSIRSSCTDLAELLEGDCERPTSEGDFEHPTSELCIWAERASKFMKAQVEECWKVLERNEFWVKENQIQKRLRSQARTDNGRKRQHTGASA